MRVSEVRLAILVVLAAASAGCATSTYSITPTVTFVDMPPVGELSEASIGSSLIQKAKVYVVDGLRLDSPLVIEAFGSRLELGVGDYAALSRTRLHTLYSAVDQIGGRYYNFGTLTESDIGFRKSLEDGRIDAFSLPYNSGMIIPHETDESLTLTEIEVTAVQEPSFRQELIYNGRIGDTIRVLYREFQNDMARPAFTQDVVYDLSESNIIGFRDVRIEIVDANNTRVRYSVISGFPDIE